MKNRYIASLGLAMTLAVAGSFNPAHAGSASYEVLINTSDLAPGPGGLIDVTLNASMPTGSPSVSATVFAPITDGTISPGASVSDPYTGTAAGDLTTTGGITMDNSNNPSEVGQDFSVASFFDVFVTLSGPEIGSGAVGPWTGSVLTLTVFDSGSGMHSAQFTVNPNVDTMGNPIVDGQILPIGSDGNVVIIPAGSVPEPSGVVLMGLGGGALVAVGRRRWRKRAA